MISPNITNNTPAQSNKNPFLNFVALNGFNCVAFGCIWQGIGMYLPWYIHVVCRAMLMGVEAYIGSLLYWLMVKGSGHYW